MASTYSTNLKLELIGTGDQSGTWGATTNTNMGTLIEQAIAGYATQAVTDSGVATVLTIPDGASSTGRNYVIALTGALTAARTVEVPAVNKPYIFFNSTTGGFAVTVKVTGQTGVVIANGKKAIVYTNTTDVIEVANAPATEAGTQTLTNKTLTAPVISTIVNTGTLTLPTSTDTLVGRATTDTLTNKTLTTPVIGTVIGGTSASSSLTLQSTSGVGTSDSILFKVGNNGATTAMTVDTSGNVGVGTGPSETIGATLEVKGAVGTALRIRSTLNSVEPTSYYTLGRDTDGLLKFNGAQTTFVGYKFFNTGSEVMRIDSSGNVGIGTSSPSTYGKLAVLGSDGTGFTGITSINSNVNVGIAGVQFGSDPTYVKAAIGLVRSNANGVGSLVFYNDSNTDAANWSTSDEKMRIDSSGNVGIGTASPVGRLHVSGTDATGPTSLRLQNTTATTGKTWQITSTDTGLLQLATRPGVADYMTVDTSGNVGIGATANASAILDAQSTTKGVRFPNMTTTEKNAISSPAAGLVVFDTTLAKLCVYSGSAWQTITSV
jgi:hypothetical protein